MTTLREAAQQALEALEDDCLVRVGPHSWERRSALAIAALTAALAEPTGEDSLQVGPVAWYFEARHIDSAWAAAVTLKHPGPEGKYMRKVTPLYAASPRCPNCASLEAQNTEPERPATLSSPRGSLGEEA